MYLVYYIANSYLKTKRLPDIKRSVFTGPYL